MVGIKNRIRFYLVNLYFQNFKKKLTIQNKKYLLFLMIKQIIPLMRFFTFVYLARFYVLKNFEVHFVFLIIPIRNEKAFK